MEHKQLERQKYNKLILEEISKMVEKYPDVRFNQLLYAIKINEELENVTILEKGTVIIIDKFNEESSKTYQTLKGEI